MGAKLKLVEKRFNEELNKLPRNHPLISIAKEYANALDEEIGGLITLIKGPGHVKSQQPVPQADAVATEGKLCPKCKSDDWDSIGKNCRCNKCNERWSKTLTEFAKFIQKHKNEGLDYDCVEREVEAFLNQ